MKTQRVLIGVLVVGLLLPAASAQMPTQANSHGPASGTVTASSGAESAQQSDATNYTRLYISEEYNRLELKPGETDSFQVTVENGEDSAVTLNPHLYLPRVGERPVKREWVSIEPGNVTLAAGETKTFNVTVSIPKGAQQEEYRGAVAFTDEMVTYPGRPPRPVHFAAFSVEVEREPTVHIRRGEYGFRQVRAGGSMTHTITIENTGDQAVPVNPSLKLEERERDDDAIRRSWVEIDAPNEIPAGETANVTVTVTPPEDADRGRYELPIDLGLKDPARPEDYDYWQRVDLELQVWKQPEEPIERQFSVSEDATNVTLKLSTYSRFRGSENARPVHFDVTFVSPSGETIEANRVRVTDEGEVDLAENDRERYEREGGEKRFTYRLDDPEAGTWSVRIMPHNAIQFGYEITRHEK